MKNELRYLYEDFMNTPLAQLGVLTHEDMFYAGCAAMKQELDRFIEFNTTNEGKGLFVQGQNDGLLWVKDHVEFLCGGGKD